MANPSKSQDKVKKGLWLSKVSVKRLKELSDREKRPEPSIVEILIDERYEAVKKSSVKPTEIVG